MPLIANIRTHQLHTINNVGHRWSISVLNLTTEFIPPVSALTTEFIPPVSALTTEFIPPVSALTTEYYTPSISADYRVIYPQYQRWPLSTIPPVSALTTEYYTPSISADHWVLYPQYQRWLATLSIHCSTTHSISVLNSASKSPQQMRRHLSPFFSTRLPLAPHLPQQRQQQKHRPMMGMRMMKATPTAAHTTKPM